MVPLIRPFKLTVPYAVIAAIRRLVCGAIEYESAVARMPNVNWQAYETALHFALAYSRSPLHFVSRKVHCDVRRVGKCSVTRDAKPGSLAAGSSVLMKSCLSALQEGASLIHCSLRRSVRGESMRRINEKRRPVLRCQACGLLFYAIRKDSVFCDRRCYNRNLRRRHVSTSTMGAKEIPLTREIIDLRESILRAATYHADLYSVTSVDLGVSFPLPGDSTRSSGLPGRSSYYQLDPFEFPMVPIDGLYSLQFFTRSGCEVKREDRPNPELLICFTYNSNPRKTPVALREAIKQIRRDRKPPTPVPKPTPKSERPPVPRLGAKPDKPAPARLPAHVEDSRNSQPPAGASAGVALVKQPSQAAGKAIRARAPHGRR